ncbi:MAG: TlpA disulfide reductase family protein [Gemmatimonadaceae bacterium]
MTSRKQFATVLGVLVAVLAIAIVGRQMLGDEMSPLGLGSRAPDFTASTLASQPESKSLEDYRGQVVMLNVWATWCGPCRIEMPSMELLHKAYGDKGLRIVAVSIDDPGTEQLVRDFVEQYGLTFEILHDPAKAISRQYQTTGYPETVILGRDGIIRKKLIGATDWNSPDNRALIERLIAESAE